MFRGPSSWLLVMECKLKRDVFVAQQQSTTVQQRVGMSYNIAIFHTWYQLDTMCALIYFVVQNACLCAKCYGLEIDLLVGENSN
jgi:hypothetical protein